MSIHKYVGCGDVLFFSCPEFHIDKAELHTESFDEAEIEVMQILQDKLNELVEKMNCVISEYNS